MIRHRRRLAESACAISNRQKNEDRKKEELKGPFESCSKCPYPAHGFRCYKREGDCLKTHIDKMNKKRKKEREKEKEKV